MMMVSLDGLKKDGITKNVKLLGKCILTLLDFCSGIFLSAASSNPTLFVRKPA